jgi:CubicO group peptidase (beta-lactamase class C family)
MTAVLVMQLRDEGQLELEDRLDRHLPEAPHGDRDIRSVLSHASGMPSEPAGPWWERSPGVGYEQLAAAEQSPGPFAPGTTHHYSNLGYGLLGELVARLSGATWWETLQARILDPLGMTRTTYHPAPPAARGYSVHPFAGTLTGEPAQDTRAMAAAGQLWSTMGDLATYAGLLLGRHEHVLRPATLTEMATPQPGTAESGLAGGYGLGLRLVPGDGTTLVGHTGSMPGFLAGLLVDRARGTAAMCLANGTAGLRCEGLPRDLLAELERSEPTVVPAWAPVSRVPARVAEVLGLWHWGNTAYVFSYDGREVLVTAIAGGGVSNRFVLREDGTFVGTAGYHHGERLYVERHDDGSVAHLRCATFIYTRSPYDPAAPIPGGPPPQEG